MMVMIIIIIIMIIVILVYFYGELKYRLNLLNVASKCVFAAMFVFAVLDFQCFTSILHAIYRVSQKSLGSERQYTGCPKGHLVVKGNIQGVPKVTWH
jgi:uncharacterized membrane protein